MKLATSCLIFLCLSGAAFGQRSLPRFGSYSVPVERSRIKELNFRKDPDARAYWTRLSAALRNGVNFAGHYVLVGWGCGTGCSNAAVIDVRNGRVLWPDEFTNIDATYGGGYSEKQLDFRKGSRLLILRGKPGSRDENAAPQESGDYYYEWKNDRFRLIRFVEKPAN